MSMRYPTGFISSFFNPLNTPNAPTQVTATAGNARITLTFIAPSESSDSPNTSYVATARRTSDGTVTSGTGTSSPVVVTGLVNGAAYTATVAAVNAYGSGVSSAQSGSLTPALPAIGTPMAGGFFAGQISTTGNGVATHYLIVGPKSTAESTAQQWLNPAENRPAAASVIDGPTNTNNIGGPASSFCRNLSVGGFVDWYLPAKNELEVCYFNLKPATTSNNTSSGINPNAVPARASNYTAGNPAQTSVVAFQSAGVEAFGEAGYWTSTQFGTTTAWLQTFGSGQQYTAGKTYNRRVRAIRRTAPV